MDRKVKGTIFADYSRMIKSTKGVIKWEDHLSPDDLAMIDNMILPSSWYPLEAYKRIGLAVFKVVAKGQLKLAWLWGRNSLDEQIEVYKNLVQKGDPIGTFRRFSDFRNRFLNFDWSEIKEIESNRVQVIFKLAFGDEADIAYAHQFGGILERLAEVSGAQNVKVIFLEKCWEGSPLTIFEVTWS